MTMKKPVFFALAEMKPVAGCEIVDPQDTAGAVIRCFMVAANARSAESRMRSTLAADHFQVVNVEFCVDYDETDWENPEDR